MTTITTRSGKGSPLTNNEVDANFTNLNDDKVEASGDSMTGNLSFGDNNKAIFGAGSDLQIYHDGGASYVQDTGTGALYLQGDGGVNIRNAAGTENKAVFASDGAVTLYHNNAVKFATTSTGIDVTGSITTDGLTSVGGFISIGADGAGDDFRFYGDTSGRYMEWVSSVDSLLFRDGAKALFGNGSDLQIYHDGSNSYVKENGTGNLWVTSNGTSVGFGNNDLSELYAVFNNDGEAKLFFNGIQKFATSSTGIDVTGDTDTSGLFRFGVNNSEIANNYVRFKPTGAAYIDHSTVGQVINFRLSASSSLDTTPLVVNSTGIDVTGTVTADGLSVDGSSSGTLNNVNFLNTNSGATTTANRIGLGITNSAGAAYTYIEANEDGIDAYPHLNFYTGVTATKRLEIEDNGDISFYEDTGTTAKLFWDASAERLGLGTSSPAELLVLDKSSGDTFVRFDKSGTFKGLVGISDSAGSGSSSAVAGDVILRSQTRVLLDTGGTTRAVVDASGNVGIGTDSPQASLSLASSTSDSNGIKMQASGWPHYVRSGINGTTGSQFIQSTNWNAATNTVDSSSHAATALILDTSSGSIQFRTETTNTVPTERMRIDSAGRVGIGCSPDFPLHVSSTGVVLGLNATSGAVSQRFNENGTARFFLSTLNGSNGLAFVNGDGVSERMRINSAGDWVVSNTVANVASNYSTQGGCGWVESDNHFEIATTSNRSALEIGKNNANDGAIITFRKQSSPVGSIGTASSRVYIGTDDTGLRFTNDEITPFNPSVSADRNGTVDLGGSSTRFKDLYLSGNINLSASSQINSSTAFYLDSDIIHFRRNNEAESARIDSSGNLLVGQTAADSNSVGIGLLSNGTAYAVRNGSAAFIAHRKSSDGNIVEFLKDNTTVGSIGTASGYLQVQSAGGNFRWGANNTNQLSVDATQMYPMTDNALNLGAPSVRFKDLYLSGGAYLGGTGSANKLDDYEEGTWTPDVRFGNANTGITYSDQQGRYIKIGEMVMVRWGFRLSSKGTATGACAVNGLPFAIAAISYTDCVGTAGGATYTGATSALHTIGENAGTRFFIFDSSVSASTNLDDGNFNNTTYMFGILIYTTSA